MKKRVEKSKEPKSITAQPPEGIAGFSTLVPRMTMDGPTSARETCPGCYHTPPKKPAP